MIYPSSIDRQERSRPGFTLIELLVVIGIISLLVSILLPSLSRAKELAKEAICMTSVKAQMTAIHMYAAERNGNMPVGPETDFSTMGMTIPGLATNQVGTNEIWMGTQYNAHGVMLDAQLENPQAYFCPSDTSADAPSELAKIRQGTAQSVYCSYIYRQLDAREPGNTSMQLANLGRNNAGDNVRALVFDMNSRMIGAPERVNHEAQNASIGYADGSVRKVDTPNEELTLPAGAGAGFMQAIDAMFELADTSQL